MYIEQLARWLESPAQREEKQRPGRGVSVGAVRNETVPELEVFILALLLVTPTEDQLEKKKSSLRV